MNNNTPKTGKLPEVTLQIQLPTGIAYETEANKLHTQIDYTSYYAGAIQWAIKTIFVMSNDMKMLANPEPPKVDATFREHIQLLLQISNSLNEWLPDFAADLRKASEPKEEVLDLPEMSAESLGADGCKADSATNGELAQIISGLLHNPNLPEPLYNGLSEGLTETFNQGKAEVKIQNEETPEHVAFVLRAYGKEAKQ